MRRILALLGMMSIGLHSTANNPEPMILEKSKNIPHNINSFLAGGGGNGGYKNRGPQMVSPYTNKKRKAKNRAQRKARKKMYNSRK